MKRYVNLALVILFMAIGVSRAAAEQPDVETTDLPVKIVKVFEDLLFDEPIDRPIVVTHANDDSGRLFIASQKGQIYVLPDSQDPQEHEVFMDFFDSVTYKDKENEEGLLGFVFHPNFKENRQFFLFYTTREVPHTSIISRFTVDADNPNRADPATEEELMRIPQPFWNHNGGTLVFGPDGYLYIALGDGGAANDPHGNGQNLATWNGSILRIDVDSKQEGLAYAVPADNPFVDVEGARPEIYAYGIRNIWRMAFDPETDLLWAADVGQNLWEEIDIIEKGGNYGWNLREGMHPFGEQGVGPRDDLIEPIWEYHHDIGKSITGGVVYRGKKIRDMQGLYLFADYVTGKVWGLRYDERSKKVTAHHEVKYQGDPIPVITFGEDQDGEVYFTDPVGNVYTFVSADD